MNKKRRLFSLLLLPLLLLVGCGNDNPPGETTPPGIDPSQLPVVTETKVQLYDGPKLMESSSLVDISVEGHPVFVYETRVNHRRSFTYTYSTDVAPVAIFDFEGKIKVDVTVNDVTSITSATVSPLSYGIDTSIQGNTISFYLEYSGNYTVEYDGLSEKAIHIFANPLEKEPLTAEDMNPGDVYIGPGVYSAGAIPTKSNQTIYLAGGAYVYGQIRAEGIENLTIRGRGIIAGSIYDRTAANQFTLPIEIKSSKNIKIEGITILDPAGWAVTLYKDENVEVDNLKIMTARGNGDGISVQSCKDVTVKGGFVRTWDDSLVVKNSDRGSTNNILFDGVVVWTDLAQSMEVGYETNGPVMDNIEFRNITVVHNFHKAAMSIHNCDDAHITNVKYRNITIEDAQNLGDVRDDGENDFLIDMTVAYNLEWSESEGMRGSVEGVLFENIIVHKMLDTVISRAEGEAPGSDIKNVTFRDIKIEDKEIKKEADLGLVKNQYVSSLKFEYDAKRLSGALISYPYRLELASETATVNKVESIEQDAYIVPDFAHMTSELSYMGEKAQGNFVANATHGAGTTNSTPVDDGSGANEKTGNPASNLIDNNRETVWIAKDWTNVDKEFAGVTIEFEEPQYIGNIRLLGDKNNKHLYNLSLQVWGLRVKDDGSIGDKYVRILSTNTYELTPQSGNSIDLSIAAQNYKGIQFRIFRVDGNLGQSNASLAEVEFYAPNLAYGKPIVDASEHADVYPTSKITDGDPTGTSYYESAAVPAFFIVDLQNVYDISVIVLRLPPVLLWDIRTQNIEILASDQNVAYDFDNPPTFKTVVEATDYVFDPTTGNMATITFETPISARYLKFIYTSNSIAGGYGAQISELNVYGS